MQKRLKVLVLGATGMLGHEVLRVLNGRPEFEAFGSMRSASLRSALPTEMGERLLTGVDVLDADVLATVLARIRPDAVINCVGLVKQLGNADDPLAALPLNALFPHRLARLCELVGARVVHISTDCVFKGDRGMYKESDAPDATDLYGRSKLLGELTRGNAITLRTSIIGREIQGQHGLVDWFLHAPSPVKGFANAIFSGLTTHELAKVIGEVVLPRPELQGLWHVSAAPIDKYSLLKLINAIYGKGTTILEDREFKLDRSLDSSRFQSETGYRAPDWNQMISAMHANGI
ncbi:dTDP-4-dehydrorhamnose reductase [Variovorax sp. TBS-050B]|uniref:dTDP-4-dehydrorhamnose reductase family protein n=1 Tax=Variovorax sp. TBS-050B TaxID=2940551 RepID=UPI002475679B|nr:SDR family oxidoreductase [Variovorax sp. TBS-050B]MDH6594949.1 dTDP-4-dehydrorhamnose reductase [Variovorax sp. TBS-050B]